VREAPGLSGLPGAALDTLARTLVALGRLAVEHPEVVEVDVNPLVIGPTGAVAVDALVVLDRAGAR
jgi:acetyltransferase